MVSPTVGRQSMDLQWVKNSVRRNIIHGQPRAFGPIRQNVRVPVAEIHEMGLSLLQPVESWWRLLVANSVQSDDPVFSMAGDYVASRVPHR